MPTHRGWKGFAPGGEGSGISPLAPGHGCFPFILDLGTLDTALGTFGSTSPMSDTVGCLYVGGTVTYHLIALSLPLPPHLANVLSPFVHVMKLRSTFQTFSFLWSHLPC